ncbi:serine acetyltransferase [Curtobacterium sp. Leaf183]|uniref:serine acetyltransferase n=1 Tax=Curtobacterium sp. Leaf183 TaxID=1736291 RepID=UPI000ADAA6E5|nr:serine acetyltransferase [Curtobacterium sp. Leaf183]
MSFLLADPSALWYLSTRLHARGHRRLARLIKGYNYLVFHAVLPPEARLAAPVVLGHLGLGVVVHPNVSLGKGVRLWHGVTLSVTDSLNSSSRLTIGDNVTFGAGCAVVSREREGLTICSDVAIGANAVVTRDISEKGNYGGVPAVKLAKIARRPDRPMSPA